MNRIHIKGFGLAMGLTAALLYLGCVLTMRLGGAEHTKEFFNSLLHGIDVSTVLRMDVSFKETLFGLTQTFIVAWLAGASIAAIYNTVLHVLSDRKIK